MRFLPVIPPHMGSKVAEPRLPGRPTSIRTEVRDGVVHVGRAVDGRGVGKHVGRITQLELLTQAGGDLVAVDRDMPRREIDDWFQT